MSIASHELKTPLTSLRLQAQIRRRDLLKGNLQKFTADYLLKLFEDDVRQVNRLDRLVDDMLDISRIQTGKLTLNVEEFDLAELMRETIDRFAAQIQATGVPVTLHADQAVIGHWDRFRIEQVISNLLTNALKYGNQSPITIHVHPIRGTAELSVTDRGIGIAKADQDRIFGQFERAISHNSISGLGLGLYIAKKIIDAHRGTIEIESELGSGSTFTLRLPMA